MKRKLSIFAIGGGLLALAIHVYDLVFVKFTTKDTVLALLWVILLCSMFLNLRRDTPPKNIHTKE
jgi:hypothetical protein